LSRDNVMDFKDWVGTTGVATDFNYLYVANNKVISVLDQSGNRTDIPHSYDIIAGMTLGSNTLYGICEQSNKTRLFQMNLETHKFDSIELDYKAVSIFFYKADTSSILVLDSAYKIYTYELNLKVKKSGTEIPLSLTPVRFMTFGMTQTEDKTYFSTNDKIIDIATFTYAPVTVDGNILTILYYMKFLFIIYVSDYNQYSIIQYDLQKNVMIEKKEGGMITGPPLYACIFNNELIISASTNKKIPMSLFKLPNNESTGAYVNKDDDPSSKISSNPYRLFDVPNNPRYIDQKIELQLEEIRTKNQSFVVDTKPAETSLLFSYVWIMVSVVILSIMGWLFYVNENKVENSAAHWVALFVVLVAILFILYHYIHVGRFL